MGVTQAAGLSLNWFRKSFAKDISYKELDALCAAVPIGSERLIYLPYLMGERTPLLDPDARGVFFGLSASHSTPHLARAVMEGVSFSLKDCLGVIDEVGIEAHSMALCGGGGKSPFWRQMLSDVYGREISVPESDEGAALGVAILAGVAAGIYETVEAGCRAAVRMKSKVQPCEHSHAEYMRYYKIYGELYPAIKENLRKLAEL
jgi:xylulokinase